MRKPILFAAVVLLAIAGTSSVRAQYDPALFTVCPSQSCYLTCPAGDDAFCFCISYDGAPLAVASSQVYMSIECLSGSLYICPGENLDKSSHRNSTGCSKNPGCGNTYCWYFQVGACCSNARIRLHMIGDPTPFYEDIVTIKSVDVNRDGRVNLSDYGIFGGYIGTSEVCYDYNCDGIVDSVDEAIIWTGLNSHSNHSCSGPIETGEATWSRIKMIYR